MALGRTCVTLGVLLVVTASKAIPILGGCAMPYVLNTEGNAPAKYEEDASGQYTCPKGYQQYGDLCTKVLAFGKSYSNPPEIMEMDFATAKTKCEGLGAKVSIASMRDLANPNIMKATEDCLTDPLHGQADRDLLMDDSNSCVRLVSGEWGQQFRACPCRAKRNKMIICFLTQEA
ncbi:uncharacterized protein [Branchiostoma lanceolatum]|uniref:uncharacterized protein isoform X2 n=1 Tax=Branchiostoma lanceolatum TaxID=7740 RepID=UPI00345462CB